MSLMRSRPPAGSATVHNADCAAEETVDDRLLAPGVACVTVAHICRAIAPSCSMLFSLDLVSSCADSRVVASYSCDTWSGVIVVAS